MTHEHGKQLHCRMYRAYRVHLHFKNASKATNIMRNWWNWYARITNQPDLCW